MANTNSSTYLPASSWNTLLQPFYVLSIVIGVLIGTSIFALAIRGCARRTAARRRFVRAVDGGWVVPVFNISDDANVDMETKNVNGPKPIMRESVLNLDGGVQVDGGMWEKALPLSMTLLPTPTSRPHDLLLYLLRSPSILTPNLFSRLRAIQFVRSNQTQYHHRFLAPPDNSQNPEEQSAVHRPSVSTSSPHLKSKERTSEATTAEPIHVMFVIAMPRPPPLLRPRVSPATAHEPAIPIANQELCVGVVSASLQVPVQYLKSRRDEQAVAIRHGNMQEVVEEEEEMNYASTIHSRRVRSEDPGHEFAGSFVSSRHMHVGNYGDEESSYMPHRTASASPSFWEDYGGAVGGGGGSTHETHNSYLAPPPIRYRPNAQAHGRDDFSSVDNQQHQVLSDHARSGDDSDYPPSRAYTPSLVSAPIPPPDASAPPASSTSVPLHVQPKVLISDPGPSLAAPGDMASHQSDASDHLGLAAHRVSQFTTTTDTTASTTDVEGGYDADADAGRRLSLKPRGAARRRAGS